MSMQQYPCWEMQLISEEEKRHRPQAEHWTFFARQMRGRSLGLRSVESQRLHLNSIAATVAQHLWKLNQYYLKPALILDGLLKMLLQSLRFFPQIVHIQQFLKDRPQFSVSSLANWSEQDFFLFKLTHPPIRTLELPAIQQSGFVLMQDTTCHFLYRAVVSKHFGPGPTF